jgi:Putative DNA-binding domain
LTLFLERYLKKTRPEDITYQDFLHFLQQGVEEHQTLEYKPRGILVKQDNSIIKSSNPRDLTGFAELAKSVAGFANAEGGLLVLGVREKPEKYKGEVVKIRPGVISALPMNVTREIIENELLAKIQYPIEGITIVPLRSSTRSSHFIYLIDVPQSIRAPHRVNELYYFQRYNFSTREMKHFQIADMFGRRLSPDLELGLQRKSGQNEDRGHFTVHPLIFNRGKVVAKYVTSTCKVLNGPYEIMQSSWQKIDERRWQFATGSNNGVYPDIHFDTGFIEFQPLPNPDTNFLILQFGLYAEGMPGKVFTVPLDPKVFIQQWVATSSQNEE